MGKSLIILKEGLERVERDKQGTDIDSLQNREEALLSWGEPMDPAWASSTAPQLLPSWQPQQNSPSLSLSVAGNMYAAFQAGACKARGGMKKETAL